MAPGVAKSFCKELKKVLDIRYTEGDYGDNEKTEDGYLTNQGVYKKIKRYREENRLIMNEAGYRFIREILREEYCGNLGDLETDSVFKQTERLVTEATHQAMEALIHNLNSMHVRQVQC